MGAAAGKAEAFDFDICPGGCFLQRVLDDADHWTGTRCGSCEEFEEVARDEEGTLRLQYYAPPWSAWVCRAAFEAYRARALAGEHFPDDLERMRQLRRLRGSLKKRPT